MFWDPQTGEQQLNAVMSAADVLGIALDRLEVRGRADAEAGFAAAHDHHAGALVMLSSPFVGSNTKLLADLAQAQRLKQLHCSRIFRAKAG